MADVINLKEWQRDKIFYDHGLDPKNLLLCFDGCQFVAMLKKISEGGQKPINEVLGENTDLYRVGYLDVRFDKVHIINDEKYRKN